MLYQILFRLFFCAKQYIFTKKCTRERCKTKRGFSLSKTKGIIKPLLRGVTDGISKKAVEMPIHPLSFFVSLPVKLHFSKTVALSSSFSAVTSRRTFTSNDVWRALKHKVTTVIKVPKTLERRADIITSSTCPV